MKPQHEERPYQIRMENAVIDYLLENETGNPLVAACGGSGKSFVMSRLAKRFVTEWPGTRIIVLAQDAKLLTQNSNELLRYWSKAPMGIYSSGLKQRDTEQDIIFCGIQSVAKRGSEFGERHIVMIDEADLVSPKDDALYNKFLETLRESSPHLRVVGFTASPWRLGTGCLTNLPLWSEIVINLTQGDEFMWFIDNGYLSPLINKAGVNQLDVSDISMKMGEFDDKSLQAATDTHEMNNAVVSEALKYGADRKHWICFSAGVLHGQHLAKIFNSRGIPTEMLCGKDSMEHRNEVEDRWRSGEIRCVVNAGLYGRGFDFPGIDMIIFARATQSPALWLQSCVRGSRVAPGKKNCLIIDMVGNTDRLGPINAIRTPAPRRKGDGPPGDSPLKICPICYSYRPIQEKVCGDCGTQFPPPKTMRKTASDKDILVRSNNGEPIIEDFRVSGIKYKSHLSKADKLSLKVTYNCVTQRYHEYLNFGSENAFMNRKAEAWWTYRNGQEPVPETVDEAVERAGRELRIPTIIRVDVSKKYPEIVGADWEEDAKLEEEKLPPFDPERCGCGHPNAMPPCSYCESGDYEPF